MIGTASRGLRHLGILTALLLMTSSSHAGTAVTAQPNFGTTADGETVDAYTLTNSSGVTAKLITRGATLARLIVPDREGRPADIVLGFDDVAGYESEDNQYFGCTTGRVCGRIAKGKFTLGDKEYTLAVNNGPNHLHGGVKRALDKVVWKAEPFQKETGAGVTFRYNSPAGEEGYPGNVRFLVRYTLNDTNDLRVDFEAETDETTPVNVTNHSYFNLAGEGSPTVLDHVLTLEADRYTPTDDGLIPTGEIRPVEGTPLDFRKPHVIGERIKSLDETPSIGYDHNYVLSDTAQPVRRIATLKEPKSGRVLVVSTDQPAVQLYTGNFLKGQKGKGGKTYAHRSAVCLETQHYPDSVNHPNFPSILLQPGRKYTHVCVYSFQVE